jgi:ribose 5-phosphate isomerase A
VSEDHKRQAALRAAQFVESGMVVGLGYGSTAKYAVQEIARRLAAGELSGILGVPAGLAVEQDARRLGIPLTDLDEHPEIDLTIDGADEVDPQLNLIKGGGGALLREKIIAEASRRAIIVVDESKLSDQLGCRFPVPVEVLPFGWAVVARFVEALGATVTLRGQVEGAPFETDQRNWILDAQFGPLPDPQSVADRLQRKAGVIAHGLFLGLATDVIVAGKGGLRHLRRDEV